MVFVWFLAGGGVEVLNASMRWWSIERLGLHARAGHARGLAVVILAGGYALRLGLTGLVLVFAFHHSALSGLAALVGYWICRWIMIWRVTRHFK
jgi:hypothetical protein